MLRLAADEATPKGPPCVLDVALSLAPAGLYWTLGLAGVRPVWLPPCHWDIVNDNAFLADARLVTRLAGVADHDSAAEILRQVREDWQRARDELAFETLPGVFWPASGLADSVVPKDNDGTVVERFHVLSAGLDNRRRASVQQPSVSADPLTDCIRESLALAVALGDRRAIVLSPMTADESTPLPAEHLASADVECRQLTDAPLIDQLRPSLLPALIASGLAVPVANRRLRLAGLFMAAPGVLAAATLAAALAEEEEQEDGLTPGANADRGEAALWDDASAIWWELP
jgi:hypothetical protein